MPPSEEIFVLGLKLRWPEDVTRSMPILRRKWYMDRVRKQDEHDKKEMKAAQRQNNAR